MYNYLHKTKKGELPMYELIAMVYKTVIIICIISLFFLLTS